ncbi:hypothetical protein J437_LFUL007357 [Ladona fulva]|uniref:Uncharacterized protein n=1 Tax=Ladona fulva TaxID=123851 RepID=A0A8K0KFS8_LADFU|nr:hypothetical protein J437_LFUL007357 [Ladona fulva]
MADSRKKYMRTKLLVNSGTKTPEIGEMSIDGKPCSGHSSTSQTDGNVEKICEIILENQRWIIEEVVELSGVTRSSVQYILTEDLGMKMVDAKFVLSQPVFLTKMA